jgi:hypothetical protein
VQAGNKAPQDIVPGVVLVFPKKRSRFHVLVLSVGPVEGRIPEDRCSVGCPRAGIRSRSRFPCPSFLPPSLCSSLVDILHCGETMIHVGPQSYNHLEEVACALRCARKVIVVTGAGISTAAGIPVRGCSSHDLGFALTRLRITDLEMACTRMAISSARRRWTIHRGGPEWSSLP